MVGADAYIRPRVDVGIDPYEINSENSRKTPRPSARESFVIDYSQLLSKP